jgi:hypothetical protein
MKRFPTALAVAFVALAAGCGTSPTAPHSVAAPAFNGIQSPPPVVADDGVAAEDEGRSGSMVVSGG